jgi:hypothetical protein
MDINTHLRSGIKHEREPLPEKESVACMNEELVMLHADLRPPRLPRLRRIARRDCEYIRCGTATVLCDAHPKAGQPDNLKWRTTRKNPHGIRNPCRICRLGSSIPESKSSNDCSCGSEIASSAGVSFERPMELRSRRFDRIYRSG